MRDCTIHDHAKYPEIHKRLVFGTISDLEAARELNVSDSMIRYHMNNCIGTEEIVIDDTDIDPFTEMLGIARQLLRKSNEMLLAERFTHEGEKISSLVKTATDTIVKLNRMGRTFVPISEKVMQGYRKDYDDLLVWLTETDNMCLDCRVKMNEYLETRDKLEI